MSESLNPLMGPPQAYVAHPGHGSVGPVIGVLAAITILGVIAIVIGRLCSGHRVMGRVGYDMEGWVETKCASCIDGRVDPPPPPPPPPRARRQRQHGEESGGDSQGLQHPSHFEGGSPSRVRRQRQHGEESGGDSQGMQHPSHFEGGSPPRVKRQRQHGEESGGDSQGQQKEAKNSRASNFGREDNNARESGWEERERGNGRNRTGSQDPSENV